MQKPTLDEVFLALTGHDAADQTGDATRRSGRLAGPSDSNDELTLEVTR